MRYQILMTVTMLAIGAFSTSSSKAAENPLKSGSFVGQSGHTTRGDVRIIKQSGKTFVVLSKNFFLDGAPDPKVAFGKNGFVKGTIIGKLRKLTGEQRYSVPAALDIRNFNQVYIWCEKFAVPLGIASVE